MDVIDEVADAVGRPCAVRAPVPMSEVKVTLVVLVTGCCIDRRPPQSAR